MPWQAAGRAARSRSGICALCNKNAGRPAQGMRAAESPGPGRSGLTCTPHSAGRAMRHASSPRKWSPPVPGHGATGTFKGELHKLKGVLGEEKLKGKGRLHQKGPRWTRRASENS